MDRTNHRRRLLDNYELNLGQSAIIPRPQISGVAMGEPVRLLDLRGDSEMAETFSVVLGAVLTHPEADIVQRGVDITGPLTGIVEFGNGSGLARVEFDIPPPSRFPFAPINGPVANYQRYLSNWRSGVSLAVPGSSVRVLARNDNNMPLVVSPSTIYGSANAGDVDPTVFAFAARFGTYGSSSRQLRKTVRIGTLQVNDNTSNYVPIGIPAFAKNFTLHRVNASTTSFHVVFYDQHGNTTADYYVATNQWGPWDVPAWSAYCHVENVGAAQATEVSLVFDLTI